MSSYDRSLEILYHLKNWKCWTYVQKTFRFITFILCCYHFFADDFLCGNIKLHIVWLAFSLVISFCFYFYCTSKIVSLKPWLFRITTLNLITSADLYLLQIQYWPYVFCHVESQLLFSSTCSSYSWRFFQKWRFTY